MPDIFILKKEMFYAWNFYIEKTMHFALRCYLKRAWHYALHFNIQKKVHFSIRLYIYNLSFGPDTYNYKRMYDQSDQIEK